MISFEVKMVYPQEVSFGICGCKDEALRMADKGEDENQFGIFEVLDL